MLKGTLTQKNTVRNGSLGGYSMGHHLSLVGSIARWRQHWNIPPREPGRPGGEVILGDPHPEAGLPRNNRFLTPEETLSKMTFGWDPILDRGEQNQQVLFASAEL
jgi:hypothetical protein